jgi:lipid-A-disaccharide synthase
MKYYIIAGEASGDLHGSNFMRALKAIDAEAQFRFWGGDLMKSVDDNLVKHYKDLAFMGFLEVILNLKTIISNINFCKKDINKFKPDCIIFIDYPGFNLRIAKWAKSNGIKTHYYISPQIWAWKENRINQIKRDIDYMHVILPFEKVFYEVKHNMTVNFVGHPLIDAISKRKNLKKQSFLKKYNLSEKPIVALLPGSRKQEIRKMLKIMLSVVDDFSEYQFVIAGAPSQKSVFYKSFIKTKSVKFIENATYDLLNYSKAAIVTSGTATLETALFKVPQIVCYKSSWISYQIGKRLVNLNFISLVNLIMDREVVCELIQDKLNKTNLSNELKKILSSKKEKKIKLDYIKLNKKLGGIGASEKVARSVFESLF